MEDDHNKGLESLRSVFAGHIETTPQEDDILHGPQEPLPLPERAGNYWTGTAHGDEARRARRLGDPRVRYGRARPREDDIDGYSTGTVISSPAGGFSGNVANPPSPYRGSVQYPPSVAGSVLPAVMGTASSNLPSMMSDPVYRTRNIGPGPGSNYTSFGGFLGGTSQSNASGILGSMIGGGGNNGNNRNGNPSNRKKKPPFDFAGSIKQIIDILSDIRDDVRKIHLSGNQKGPMRGPGGKKGSPSSSGGGLGSIIKDLLGTLPLILAGAMAAAQYGPVGFGALGALGKNITNAGRDVARSGRQALIRLQKQFQPKPPPKISSVPGEMQKNLGANMRKWGGAMQNAARLGTGLTVATDLGGAISGLVHGDMQGAAMNTFRIGEHLSEYKATMSPSLKNTSLGLGAEATGAIADYFDINSRKDLTPEQKAAALAKAEGQHALAGGEMGLSALVQKLPMNLMGTGLRGVASRSGVLATGLAAIEGVEAIKGHHDIDMNQHLDAKARQKAHEDLNHATWKKMGGAAGGLLGGVAAGAAAGAVVGSIVPIAGTVVGGLVGAGVGLAGGVVGSYLGSKYAGNIESGFGNAMHGLGGVAHNTENFAKSALAEVGKIGGTASSLAGPAAMMMGLPGLAMGIGAAGAAAQHFNFTMTNNNPNFANPATMKDVEDKINKMFKELASKMASQESYSNKGGGASAGTGGNGVLGAILSSLPFGI